MNLAFKYPILYWNCACLISDSGGAETTDDEEELIDNVVEEVYTNEMEDFTDDDNEDEVEDEYAEDEDCDGYPVDVKVMKNGKKKKKTKATNYGKIATAIGKMKAEGVEVSLPDVNYSSYTFSPDVENNVIRYGLSGITRINDSIIKQIIENRPYEGIDDFKSKVKVNKTQMINLIKCGAFDGFGNRHDIMEEYIWSIADVKKKLNGQNIAGLIRTNLIPEELDFERKVFNFNSYLKKTKGQLTIPHAVEFFEQNCDMDRTTATDAGIFVDMAYWKAFYTKHMEAIKSYIKANHDELLDTFNQIAFDAEWNKYCLGNYSKWEMDSVSCYYHDHELANVDLADYDFAEFYDLAESAEIAYVANIKGKQIPIFKLERIVGTVLDRDKAKKTVTLLTTKGVVMVKIYGGVFAQYDKQLSEKGADGKKHVIEKSMFSRGTKIIVSGIRIGENEFLGKKYNKTTWHLVERIADVTDDNKLVIIHDRAEVAQ